MTLDTEIFNEALQTSACNPTYFIVGMDYSCFAVANTWIRYRNIHCVQNCRLQYHLLSTRRYFSFLWDYSADLKIVFSCLTCLICDFFLSKKNPKNARMWRGVICDRWDSLRVFHCAPQGSRPVRHSLNRASCLEWLNTGQRWSVLSSRRSQQTPSRGHWSASVTDHDRRVLTAIFTV